MAKRSTIQDIIERKERSSYVKSALWKVQDLARTWEIGKKENYLSDFIIIRLITVIEVYVRDNVKEIIDSGPEYFDKAGSLLRDIKIDFIVAKGLYGQRVTLGDIVGHAIPVNNLEQIISIYEKLLTGTDIPFQASTSAGSRIVIYWNERRS
jgi:hypothetical protein